MNLSWLKKKEIKKEQVIDSLELARGKYPGSSNSLDGLCKRFNIDLSRRTKHNALLDCELLREVYINLLDAKEPKFNLSAVNVSPSILKNKTYNKDVIEISEIEKKLHDEFLKKELKKNFYWIFFISYNFWKSIFSFIFTSLNPEYSNKSTNIFLNSL